MNLQLKESPNYQSIIDLWSDCNSRGLSIVCNNPDMNGSNIAGYFSRCADDDEMTNTDENTSYNERRVPKTSSNNLITAIWLQNLPQELDKLLENSKRLRMNTYLVSNSDSRNNTIQSKRFDYCQDETSKVSIDSNLP